MPRLAFRASDTIARLLRAPWRSTAARGLPLALCWVLLAGCESRAIDGLVRIDGSSTAYPIVEAMAEEYQARHRGQARVTVGISGTGGGFKKFCRGQSDLATASRPIHGTEIEDCARLGVQFIELPIAFDAVTVLIHPDNDWARTLTVAQLRRIWEPAAQGRIQRWNQVEAHWPDLPLRLYAPGTDSGTYDYFTEAIVGHGGVSRRDFIASEDDHVLVSGIAQDRHALGVVGFAYYRDNASRVRAVAIQAEAETLPVVPSRDSALDGSYRPLSRPVFVYVNADAARQRPHVAAMVEFLLTDSHAVIEHMRHIALPEPVYALALDRFRGRHVGTVFDGHAEVGVDVGQLLRSRMH